MVNEDKVRIMTQIALEETKYHSREIKRGEYYKSDYIRSHILSVVWNVTISYLLVICLFALYYLDYLFLNVVHLDYQKIGCILFGIYVFLIILSVLLGYLFYSKKYIDNRKILEEYYIKLELLDDFYEQNGEEAENDTTAGV